MSPVQLQFICTCNTVYLLFFSIELEQDAQIERMRKEQELRKKKEKEDHLTLEQTKEQVLHVYTCQYLLRKQYSL